MVSFNQIPQALRVPFVTAEFDSSRASQGPALLPYRGLLVGQKLRNAPAAANSVHRVSNANQVLALAGRGSMLHRMARAWFAGNTATECWIAVLDDAPSSVYATGSILVSGTASDAGVIYLYVGGQRVTVPVTAGQSASAVALALTNALGLHASALVTPASVLAGDTVTVAGVVFTGATGAVTPGAGTFSIDGTNAQVAASLAAQVAAHPVAGAAVRAFASGSVATVVAHAGGPAGSLVSIASSNGTRLAIVGAVGGFLAGAGPDTDLPIHATAAGATITLHARNSGPIANELDLRLNYQNGEALPAGISLTLGAMSSGAVNPTLGSLFATLGDNWYQVWANPYTDATSLTALETELRSRSGPMRMIDGVMIYAKNDTFANVTTLGNSRNSEHGVLLRTNNSPTAPEEIAAHVAGVMASAAADDPARPFQTLALPWVRSPALTDLDTIEERNLLLFDGVSTLRVGPGDVMQIDRLITTYQRNAAGADDDAYLDVNTPLTLMYLRYAFRAHMSTRYPRHKLASDSARLPSGQPVITPKIGKAEAVAWFQQMESSLGLVENIEQFKTDLVVERNATDPNRLDFLLPPDLINQLIVTAAKIQFLR